VQNLCYQSARVAETLFRVLQITLFYLIMPGARWAIDQLNKDNRIEVYYAVEIVDISQLDLETMTIRYEVKDFLLSISESHPLILKWQNNCLYCYKTELNFI